MPASEILARECFPRPPPALLFCGSARGRTAKTGLLTTVSMVQQYVHPRDTRESKAGENGVKSQRSPRPQGLPSASSSRMKTAPDAAAPLGSKHAQVYTVGVERDSSSQNQHGSLWGEIIQYRLGAGPILHLFRPPSSPPDAPRLSPEGVLSLPSFPFFFTLPWPWW